MILSMFPFGILSLIYYATIYLKNKPAKIDGKASSRHCSVEFYLVGDDMTIITYKHVYVFSFDDSPKLNKY